MKKTQVINLDPIDRKKKLGIIGRAMITRWSGGKKPAHQEKYGHYMFTGKQRQGKSTSCLWYLEKLARKYRKKGYAIEIYSNMGIGREINRKTLYETISNFDPYEKKVRFVLIDEIQAYFPKESRDKATIEIKEKLISLFCQLGKRNTYILSTSQIYGRVDKSLREQCLYMIDCHRSMTGKFVNEFIDGDDIICDDLGRWAGKPKHIYVHGLPKTQYDTKKIIEV